MNLQQYSYWYYFANAVKWTLGTFLFAMAPYLFLLFIGWLSEESVTERELKALDDVRFLVFACCAITGSIVWEFIRSPIVINGGLSKFAVYISPFLLLLYLFLKYLLVYVQFDDLHDFGPGLTGTRMTVVFSVLYALFAKTLLYIKSDHARRNIDL